ncbi:hypothetical protein PHMEG_00012888 [Phytophthora megakarya]|uniref:Uncharacterized protein n=1 Tax=Phytophthora megakarya TaxID=4795 RepID=A0A225W7N8_9STRA|nr:hypothetical protein PHMEG_00012888 [Phytophthora megakarya]
MAKNVINAAATLAWKMGLVTEESRIQFRQELQEFVLEKEKWRGNYGMTLIDTIFSIGGHCNPKATFWCGNLPKSCRLSKLLLLQASAGGLRNGLSPDKVNKVVFVYTNITRKCEVNHIMYQLFAEACDDSDSSNSY